MSKEKLKKENDSSEAPPCTPEFEEEKELTKEYYSICPECSSSIEIISINENNIIEYKCLKENKEFIISIKEYLEKLKEKKQKNIDSLKDICQNHKNEKYICYCFDCNCHLCNECLKTRIHINHRKSNIIEIKPMEEEISIIEEVIKDYKLRLENIKIEKENKSKEYEMSLKKEKKNEEKKLEKEIKRNKIKEEKEIEKNNNKYIEDIEEIRKEYEEKIRLRKKEYEEKKNKIYNKYKLMNEKENIKYKIKVDKIMKKYLNEIKEYKFEEKIENYENMLKINKIIFNIYNNYNNNYYNSVNINNLLLYYIKSEYINDKIMKIKLKDKYEKVVDIIKQKKKEDKKIKELKEKNEKMIKEKIEEIENKYKKEKNILEKKVIQNIL